MTRTPLAVACRALVAGAALTAMSLLAAAPANAAVPTLYTYLMVTPAYGTLDATNGAATPLAVAPTDEVDDVIGQEIAGGAGISIGVNYGEPDEYFVFTWDATGASSAGVPAFVAGADEGSLHVSGLDFPGDGTAVTYVEYTTTTSVEIPTTTSHSAIATVDSTTGELIPLVDLTDLLVEDYSVNEIATDPISGVTYLFLSFDGDNLSYYTPIDLDAGTFDLPNIFTGANFESGAVLGADFDASGTLYFIYANNLREEYELSTIGDPADWTTADRTLIGDAGSNYPDQSYPVSPLALTTAPPLALANTGAEFPVALLVVGTVAVLGGVVTVVMVSRKRRAA